MPRTQLPLQQNYLSYSNTFSNAFWSATLLTPTTTVATTDPLGGLNAWLLTDSVDGSSVNHLFQTGALGVSTSQKHCYSVYAKAGTNNYVALRINGSVTNVNLIFSLIDGTNTTNVFGSSTSVFQVLSSINCGNGWWRLSFWVDIGSISQVFIMPTNNSAGTAYQGAGTGTIYAYNAQLVDGISAGKLTITTTTPVNTGAVRSQFPLVQNLFTYSQDYSNGVWSKIGATNSANIAVAPDGTTTASGALATGTGASTHNYQYTETAAMGLVGQISTISVYAKAGAVSWMGFAFDGLAGTIYFNLSGVGGVGTLTGSSNVLPAIKNIGGGWYRCSVSFIRTHVVASWAGFFPANADGGYTYAAADTITPQVYFWGAQYTLVGRATTYQATTTSVISTGIPRTSVIQMVNMLPTSQTLADWTALGTDVYTLNTVDTVAPDGTSTAIKAAASAATNVHGKYYNSGSKRYTTGKAVFSCYAKAGTTGNLCLDFSNGNNAGAVFNLTTGVVGAVDANYATSIQDAGNGWYRCSVIGNSGVFPEFYISSSPSSKNRTSTLAGTEVLYLWGFQLEPGSVASPYVQTKNTGIFYDSPGRAAIPSVPLLQNVLTYSKDFSNAVWGFNNATNSANIAVAPDGTTTASGILANSTSSLAHFVTYGETASMGVVNQRVAFGGRFKAGAVGWVYLLASATFVSGYFQLSGNGVVGTVTGGNGYIVPLGNGWYECWLTTNRVSGPSNSCRFYPASANGVNTYAAADTVTPQIYMWEMAHTRSNWLGVLTPTTTTIVDNGSLRQYAL